MEPTTTHSLECQVARARTLGTRSASSCVLALGEADAVGGALGWGRRAGGGVVWGLLRSCRPIVPVNMPTFDPFYPLKTHVTKCIKRDVSRLKAEEPVKLLTLARTQTHTHATNSQIHTRAHIRQAVTHTPDWFNWPPSCTEGARYCRMTVLPCIL